MNSLRRPCGLDKQVQLLSNPTSSIREKSERKFLLQGLTGGEEVEAEDDYLCAKLHLVSSRKPHTPHLAKWQRILHRQEVTVKAKNKADRFTLPVKCWNKQF